MSPADEIRWHHEHQEALRRAYAEHLRAEQNEHMRDAFAYASQARQAGKPHRQNNPPPLHGAIDFHRGPDGVWHLPRTWADGDTIHYAVDPARPGGDRSSYWSYRR